MQTIVRKYGLLSGGVAALLMVLMALYTRNDPNKFDGGEVLGYIGILLSMVFVFLGVRAYRDDVGTGAITFGKAFQVGLFITLISCAIYVLAWMVVANTLMTDFMDQYIAHSLRQMQEAGKSAEEIATKAAEMADFKEMYKNPLIAAAFTFLEPFPVGLAVTLLSAAVLRRG